MPLERIVRPVYTSPLHKLRDRNASSVSAPTAGGQAYRNRCLPETVATRSDSQLAQDLPSAALIAFHPAMSLPPNTHRDEPPAPGSQGQTLVSMYVGMLSAVSWR